jgi:SAM-dependent methyltransferase
MKEDLLSKRYDLEQNVTYSDYVKKFLEDPEIKANMTTYDDCPCCGHSDFVVFAKRDPRGIPVNRVVCDHCGFIFAHNYPNEVGLRRYYSQYYRDSQLLKEVAPEDFDHFYKGSEKNWSEKPFLKGKKDPLIVEIGCGGGWFLKPYHDRGYRIKGFDYDPNLTKMGRDLHGLDLHCGSVDEAIEMGVQADYVFLSQVLEHIPDPLTFLKKLQKIMKPDSIVKISVPSQNFLIIGGGATNFDPMEILSYPHFALFDEFSFSVLARRAGFECVVLLGGQFVIRVAKHDEENVALSPGKAEKVIRYLKRCESMVPIKNVLFHCHTGVFKSLRYRLHYVYFMLHPIKAYTLLRRYPRL